MKNCGKFLSIFFKKLKLYKLLKIKKIIFAVSQWSDLFAFLTFSHNLRSLLTFNFSVYVQISKSLINVFICFWNLSFMRLTSHICDVVLKRNLQRLKLEVSFSFFLFITICNSYFTLHREAINFLWFFRQLIDNLLLLKLP